jgi:hypothetical protein
MGQLAAKSSSRKELENQQVMLVAGLYENAHRTETVKSIRCFTPERASVANYCTMTGVTTRQRAIPSIT